MKNMIKFFSVLLITLVVACGWYVNDYYHADLDAITVFQHEIKVNKHGFDDSITYAPEHADTGLIFYPGGKVETAAYEPLMAALAEKNILTVLVEMPFHLAVFDMNAADGIQQKYPDIKHWYIGGHSLGGAMAASYLETHKEDYEGLILLASYSTSDLSETSLHVLSIYGSEDNVLNEEKYQENIIHLPKDYTEIVLDGGNHAQFGMYGAQSGDGTASISNADQILQTANSIFEWIQDTR